MKKHFLSALLFLVCTVATQAQSVTGIKPLDQLVAAINGKSLALLQPYLTSETRVGTLPAAYTAQLLGQLIPQFGPIAQFRLVHQEAEGPNTRYTCALTRNGTEQEYDFLLTPAGTFQELNLAQASLKKISTTFSAQDLTTPPSLDIPLKLVNGLLLVEAEVDGRQGTFLLDSGAPALILNQQEFPAASTSQTVAVGGPQGVNGRMGAMSYYAIKHFSWQGISFENREVPTLDLAALEQRLGGPKLLGLIGYNLLSQYALTLDYRASLVLLRKPDSPALTPAPLLRLPFVLRGHLPVVEATAEGQTFQLALDCGAQNNLLDQQYEPVFASKLRHRAKDTLNGADNNPRTVTSGEVHELQLAGNLAFRKQQTVFSDISHLNKKPEQPILQGIAGYPFLSQYRTTIDYVNKQVEFRKW